MITAERLREVLDYDHATGSFTWASPTHGRIQVGSLAGYVSVRGYRYIKIDRVLYLAHRLAWLHTCGEWPNAIDHVNGNCSDNRFVNLRLATGSQNRANSKKPSTNNTGFKGVSWIKKRERWRADIKVLGKSHTVGYFPTPEAAHAAYCDAAKKHFGQFARFA